MRNSGWPTFVLNSPHPNPLPEGEGTTAFAAIINRGMPQEQPVMAPLPLEIPDLPCTNCGG